MPRIDLIKRLQSQFKKYDLAMKRSRSVKGPKSKAAQETTFALSQLAAAIISSLIASWLAQDILRNNFPLAVIVAFVLLLVLTSILQTKVRLQLSAYFLFSSMLTIIIVEGVLLAYLYVITRPPTLYLIVDATEETKPLFDQILSNILYSATLQPRNSNAGFRIYGGNLSENTGCTSTTQLAAPLPMLDYEAKMSELLPSLRPEGHASLTIAVVRAIKEDLRNIRGPVKLVVITSGLDKRCEPSETGIFEEMAKDIKANTRNDITIVIISVGELSPSDLSTLDEHAKAFNGIHLNTASPASLALLLYAPKDYFIDYPTRVTPQPTMLPTP